MKRRLGCIGYSLVYHLKALNKTKDSVTYFINIQKPLAKGDTTELLVNYKVRFLHALPL